MLKHWTLNWDDRFVRIIHPRKIVWSLATLSQEARRLSTALLSKVWRLLWFKPSQRLACNVSAGDYPLSAWITKGLRTDALFCTEKSGFLRRCHTLRLLMAGGGWKKINSWERFSNTFRLVNGDSPMLDGAHKAWFIGTAILAPAN